MSADLDKIKAEIDTIGNRIRDLKSSGGSKEDIGAAVEGLKAAKKQYADNNNGIGVDGKPFQENLTKAQKKALAKAENKGGAGGGGNVRDLDCRCCCFWLWICLVTLALLSVSHDSCILLFASFIFVVTYFLNCLSMTLGKALKLFPRLVWRSA